MPSMASLGASYGNLRLERVCSPTLPSPLMARCTSGQNTSSSLPSRPTPKASPKARGPCAGRMHGIRGVHQPSRPTPTLHWFPNVGSSILNSYIIPWITITRSVGVWSSDLIRSFRKNLFSNTSFLILASLSSNCLDSLGPQLHLLAVLCLLGRSW